MVKFRYRPPPGPNAKEGGEIEMSDSVIHDLAVAYAQAKLMQEQQEHPEDSGYSEEIRSFLGSVHIRASTIRAK